MQERATERDRASGTERSSGARTDSSKRRASRRRRRPSGKDHQEVEWQFNAGKLEEVEGWLKEYRSNTGLSIVPGSTRELTDTYLDTEDWRLYRAGYALRVRHKGSNKTAEATMKSLTLTGDGTEGSIKRREISERIKNAADFSELLEAARGPVGERLRALVGSHEVRPLFRIQTRRQAFALRLGGQDGPVERPTDEDGSSERIVQDASGDIRRGDGNSRVGEIALDATKIRLVGGEEPTSLSRVEVEVEEEAPAEVSRFVEEMRRSLELNPSTTSKYEAGLLAAGLSPDGDPDLGPADIDGSMSTGRVAFAILRRQFAAMRAHEPGTRLGEDSEELHDMRVATRRMRAALKLFSGALPEQAGSFREELKWVASALGEVWDLDVQIEQLQSLASEAEEEDREAFGGIVEAVKDRRVDARERMLEALNSDRYERLVSSFEEMLRRGPEQEDRGEGLADEPITAVAPDLVSRRYRKWRKTGKHLTEESPPEDYHELRKEGKRLRYALEFLTDVYGDKPTGKLVKPLKELQDGLGRHQDLIVAADLLASIAAGSRRLSPRTAFAMGVLAERHLREAADLRASLPGTKPYRVLTKGKAWKDLEKNAKKQSSEAKVKSAERE